MPHGIGVVFVIHGRKCSQCSAVVYRYRYAGTWPDRWRAANAKIEAAAAAATAAAA